MTEATGRVDWAHTRSGGAVGTDTHGRTWRVERRARGGFDAFVWLGDTRTWVCRSVDVERTQAKVEDILQREARRRAAL